MTKQEFENNIDPLGLIVSINIETGKVLYDTYDWRSVDGFVEDYKKDFPDMIHFSELNKSALKNVNSR